MTELSNSRQDWWMAQGACRNHKDVDFYVDKSNKTGVQKAKSICKKECKVKKECFIYAYINDIDEGIWGGAFPDERSRIAATLNLPMRGTVVDLVNYMNEKQREF